MPFQPRIIMIKRIGEICGISDENRQLYIDLHKNLSPKIKNLIKECNIMDYSIFVRGNLLFAYYVYDGEDFEADMKKMADNHDNQLWWDTVKPIMSPLPDRKDGEFWAGMEEIFFLE